MRAKRESRVTGIPRRLMDPARRYVVAHTGSRWEIVAMEDDAGALVPLGPGDVATQAERGRGPGNGA